MFLSKSIPACINVFPRFLKISRFKTIHSNVSEFCERRCTRLLSTSTILHYKIYKDNENTFAYSIMEREADRYSLSKPFAVSEYIISHERFQSLLEHDWTKCDNVEELLSAFEAVSNYASHNNVGIHLEKFDGFIDALTDSFKLFNDQQLSLLCQNVLKWPETESVNTRNFVEIWAALDDVLLEKASNWDNHTMLVFADYLYKLNLSRKSDYTGRIMNRLIRKAKQLSSENLVQTLFYISACRQNLKSMIDFEMAFESQFDKLSINELAIVSMGFFKSKSPLRNTDLIEKLINKVADEAETIPEITLNAILKLIRYSAKLQNSMAIERMLNMLLPRINNLPVFCYVHLALVGTSTHIFHEQTLNMVAQNFVTKPEKARMKDLERLTFVFAEYNFHPKTTPPIFDTIINELEKSERENERIKYGKCFVRCLSFLCTLNIFPRYLIDMALDKQFLKSAYAAYPYFRHFEINGGESCREIIVLNNSVKIECENYNGNLVLDSACRDLSKKFTSYLPEPNGKYRVAGVDIVVLEALIILRKMRGGDSFVHGEHVLPHFQKGDLIICNDLNDQPVGISHLFSEKKFGTIKVAPDSKNKWFALVFLGRYITISNTRQYLGSTLMKIRQLKKIGYRPLVITWQGWQNLNSEEEKILYLSNLIRQNSSDDDLHDITLKQ